jgi:DNA repair protein RadC
LACAPPCKSGVHAVVNNTLHLYPVYTGLCMNVRLKKEDKIKVLGAHGVYGIMQQILMRESLIDRNREHFWTVSLDNALRVLNVELVSMGTVNATLVEPMEVFSVPLQKRAVKVILVHNHPSGELEPGVQDKDTTDQLIQVGRIMHVPVLDHLIISEEAYYSFSDSGLLAELAKSLKYVPAYEIKQRYEKAAKDAGKEEGHKAGQNEKAKEIARQMKKEGYAVEIIMKITGLSKAVIGKLKVE